MHCDSFILRSLGFHRVSPSHPAFRTLSMCQKPVISSCEPCPLSRDCNTGWPTKVCQDLPNEVMELHVCIPHLPQTVPMLWGSAHPLNERDTHFSIRLPWEDTTHCSDSRRLIPKELVSPSYPSWFSAATKGAQEGGDGGHVLCVPRSSVHNCSAGRRLCSNRKAPSERTLLTSPGKKRHSVGLRTI